MNAQAETDKRQAVENGERIDQQRGHNRNTAADIAPDRRISYRLLYRCGCVFIDIILFADIGVDILLHCLVGGRIDILRISRRRAARDAEKRILQTK